MDVSTWELRAKDLANALARPNKADFSQLHRAEYQEKLIELRRDINDTDTNAQVGVPAYQQRKRQETLQTLEDQLKALQPPTQSKFSFKKQPAGPSSGAPTTSTETPVSQAEPLQAEDTVPTHQKHIVYSSSTSTSAPSLANLSRCFVDLRSGPIPSLYLKDLQDTVVVASDVQGSVLVHNAKSCLLAINCHQFRIHSSSSTSIIINARSTPVIEDCHSLRFAFLSPDGTPKPVDQGSVLVEDFNTPNQQGKKDNAAWTYFDTEQARQKYIVLANLPTEEMQATQVDQVLSFLLSA